MAYALNIATGHYALSAPGPSWESATDELKNSDNRDTEQNLDEIKYVSLHIFPSDLGRVIPYLFRPDWC